MNAIKEAFLFLLFLSHSLYLIKFKWYLFLFEIDIQFKFNDDNRKAAVVLFFLIESSLKGNQVFCLSFRLFKKNEDDNNSIKKANEQNGTILIDSVEI